MLQLSRQERQQLQEALIDAFPMKSSLEQMLSFELNKNLAMIPGEGSLQEIIFRIIQTAEAEGWIENLIRAARSKNPGNPKLQAIAQTLDPTSKIKHKDLFPQQPVTNNTYKLSFNQLIKNKLITGATVLLIGLAGFSLYNQNSNLPNNALFYYTEGLVHARKMEWDKAIDNYTEALRLNSNYTDAYYNKGLAHAGKMEWDKAIDNYTKALRLNSNYTEAYYNKGLAHAGKMEWDKAIDNYNEALRLNSNYTEAYYNRGLAYKSKGSKQKAVKDLKKVLELNNDLNNDFKLSQKASEQLQELGTK
ncbi:effector-associated domain EAD1-containing protein [Nostoc sp. CHAB 5715]|uniref:effector-associated domain EAD1-containing protein n=1 Tax=Nostoc sp. CHAB 5715 TaxID=2780400 RepID=UPI001E48807B|nr:effector-associated domain EAD1-containing protein [Nostoc sp. CHAB 5715]MCC5622337.1 effector-associated domain EAD1-containing protein [Nostoc sp. CHAB 5715]